MSANDRPALRPRRAAIPLGNSLSALVASSEAPEDGQETPSLRAVADPAPADGANAPAAGVSAAAPGAGRPDATGGRDDGQVAAIVPERPRRRTRAAAAPRARASYHQINVDVDQQLKGRLQRLIADLKYDELYTVREVEVLEALLEAGPRTHDGVRELVERYRAEFAPASEPRARRRLTRLSNRIEFDLYMSYERLISDLRLDHAFATNVTEVLSALLWDGPRTTGQLQRLMQAHREQSA